MNQILLIGRRTKDVASWLEASFEAVLNEARLPAAGLRELDATPPDVIILADDDSARMVTMLEAIRERPLGKLVPVVIVSEDRAPENTLDVLAWVAASEYQKLIDLIAHEVEIPKKQAGTTEHSQADYVLEDLDEILESEPPQPPARFRTSEIFAARLEAREESELDASDVKKKLKIVRHEDYFSILEVPRGAQTPMIREAFQKQMARFDHKSVAFEIAHALHAEIEEIRDALEDAWAVLGDAKLRTTYLEKTTRR